MKITHVGHHQEKGQSLVELGLSLMLLLIMLAGTVDLARFAFAYIVLRDGAQEAAAYGALYPTWCTQIQERAIKNTGTTFGANPVVVNVVIGGNACAAVNANACAGSKVEVTVSSKFDVLMPFIGGIIGQQIPLQYTVSDSVMRPRCP